MKPHTARILVDDQVSDTGVQFDCFDKARVIFINVDWKWGITAPLQPIVQYYGSLKT
jgi:hypothetical protein